MQYPSYEAHYDHAKNFTERVVEITTLFKAGGDAALTALDLYEQDSDNITAAQSWARSFAAVDDPAAQLCIQFAIGGWRLLQIRGDFVEGSKVLVEILRSTARMLSPLDQAEIMHGAAVLAAGAGNIAEAKTLCEESVSIKETHSATISAELYSYLGTLQRQVGGDYQSALASYIKGWKAARRAQDSLGIALAQNELGNARLAQKRYQNAFFWYEQEIKTLTMLEAEKPSKQRAICLNNLGLSSRLLRRHADATNFYHRSISVSRTLRDQREESRSLHEIGSVYRDLMELVTAVKFYKDAMVMKKKLGDRRGLVFLIEDIAGVASTLDHHQHASSLYRGSGLLLKQMNAKPMPYSEDYHHHRRETSYGKTEHAKIGIDSVEDVEIDELINLAVAWMTAAHIG